MRAGAGRAFGSKINVSGVSPDISRVIVVKWQEGSAAVPAELGQSGAFVSKDYAKELHLHVGSPIAVQTPSGRVMRLQLRGIFAPPKGGSPYGDVTISTRRFDAEYENPQNVFTFVNIAGGVTTANTLQARTRAGGLPGCEDPDREPVQVKPGAGDRHAAEPALRAALAVDHRQPVRDRQHARADRLRAHPRARACCAPSA